MAVVISFSGMGGTGKTKSSRYITTQLNAQGVITYNIRFRQMGLKTLFGPKCKVTSFAFEEVEPVTLKKVPLTYPDAHLASIKRFLLKIPYLLWRLFLYKILITFRYSNDIVICDRFVYDHLACFNLRDRRKHWIFHFFLRLIPRPDLPIVLTAPTPTIRHARPRFGESYIETKMKNYKSLARLETKIVLVKGENIYQTLSRVGLVVENFLREQNIIVHSMSERGWLREESESVN